MLIALKNTNFEKVFYFKNVCTMKWGNKAVRKQE